jgi:hypothetical protein
MSLLRALDRFWYVPAPAERLAVLRILLGSYALIYLLVRYLSLTSVTRFVPSQFDPVGPVSLLAEPLSAALVHVLTLLSLPLGFCFVAGLGYRFSAPLFALLFLWVTSYRSSWGMIFHTENLPALHLLLLAAAPAADVLSVDTQRQARAGHASAMRAPHGRYGWALRAICAITVASYLLAGIAKLRLSGLSWANGEILRVHVAYDNLRKIELGSLYSPLGAALVKVSWPFRILAWGSLLLELGAPLALLHERVARSWVTGVFAFHVGVLALMAIAFPYQLSFIAYAAFFPLERVRELRVVARFWPSVTTSRSASTPAVDSRE